MTEIRINIEDLVRKSASGFNSLLEINTDSAVRQVISHNFGDGRYGGPKGLAYEIVENKVEELILSERFGLIVDKIIEDELEGQARAAVKSLLNSKSRKHLFQSVDS